jgi:hypothetical protein
MWRVAPFILCPLLASCQGGSPPVVGSPSAADPASVGAGPAGSASTSWCPTLAPSATDPAIVSVLAGANGRHYLEGTWENGRRGTVLTIDVQTGASHVMTSGGCQKLVFDATMTLKTRDGVLGVEASELAVDRFGASLEVPLVGLPDAYEHPDPTNPWIADETPHSLTTTMRASFSASLIRVSVVTADGRVVGLWSSPSSEVPFRYPPAYVVPPELAPECTHAGDYTGAHSQYTPFASGAAALAAGTGTWIRCIGFLDGPEHAGIQVMPDGTWHDLAWTDGQLVSRPGLSQEGTAVAIDTSGMNGPGFFQINLEGRPLGHSGILWEDRFMTFSGGPRPDFQPDVYVKTHRTVAPATNPYADGARGGAAACSTPETGTLDPDLGAPLDSVLKGVWTLCAGEPLEEYTRLRFGEHGTVTFENAAGDVVATKTYQAFQPPTEPATAPRSTILSLGEDSERYVVFSARPLKMWIASGSYTSRVMVFSALP